MDLGLAAERGVDGVHAHAVGDLAAVPAALADRLVDHHPRGRRLDATPLAVAAQVGGAALVVDQGRHAGHLPQLELHRLEFIPVDHARIRRPRRRSRVLAGVIGDDDGAPHTLGLEPARQLRHRHLAGGVLAAGHGDGPVVEDLVGDVGAGRDGLADGERAGMEEGAVAQVLEEVLIAHERSGADPLRAFGAHVGEAFGVAVHVEGHGVTADAAECDRPLRYDGAAVVGAARAVIGRSRGKDPTVADQRDALAHAGQAIGVDAFGEHPTKRFDEDVAAQRRTERDQRCEVAVLLADDRRGVGAAVEKIAHLPLEEGPFLFDHENGVEAAGEGAEPLRFEG